MPVLPLPTAVRPSLRKHTGHHRPLPHLAISLQSSVRGAPLVFSVHLRTLSSACVVLRISSSLCIGCMGAEGKFVQGQEGSLFHFAAGGWPCECLPPCALKARQA